MSSYRICKTCGEYEHDCHCPKRASGSLKRVVSCELTIIRADLWAKVYAASVASPENSAARQMPREMADSAVKEFDERFNSKKAANDQAEASGASGRPIANLDAPAALPPAHGWASRSNSK